MNDDDKHTDSELKAYLDGRDGVSAAYQQSGRDEEPSAGLDKLILNAAREAVQPVVAAATVTSLPPLQPRRSLRDAYSLAASLMIGVLGASLYYSQREAPAPVTLVQESSESIPFAPAPAVVLSPPAAEAEKTVVTTEPQRDRADFAERLLPAPQPVVGTEDSVATSRSAAASNSAANSALNVAAPAAPVVISGPLLEAIEAAADAGQAKRAEAPPATAQAAAVNSLEEVQVTGSRVARTTRVDVPGTRIPAREPDRSYRDSQQEWLFVLHDLSDELAGFGEVTAENRRDYRDLSDQLEEETELFKDEYRNFDLEAELAKPQQ